MSLSTRPAMSDMASHSSLGDLFPTDPGPSHIHIPDDLHRHAPQPLHRLARSITNSSFRSNRTFGIGLAAQGISEDQYRVLMELQRLLYHGPGDNTFLETEEHEGGCETCAHGQGAGGNALRKEQLRTFVQEYFESDCLYESPLITLQSRPLLLDALGLSTDLAKGQLPSLWPRAVVTHVKGVVKWGLGKVFGVAAKDGGRGSKGRDLEGGSFPFEKMDPRARPAYQTLVDAPVVPLVEHGERMDAWWDAWEIGSECSEIGGFETYEGYHLGVIDHTMTLNLLPAFLPPSNTEDDFQPHQSSTSAYTSPAISLSHAPMHLHPLFVQALHTKTQPPPVQNTASLPFAAVQTFLASVLRYRLRVRTYVEFNEAGKISYIRDVVDLRDAWEAVVPFGRAAGWIGRRVGGVLLAGVGRVFFSSPAAGAKDGKRRERARDAGRGRGSHAHVTVQDHLRGGRDGFVHSPGSKQTTMNALGLQEAWSPRASASLAMSEEPLRAPDVDEGGEMTDH